MKVRPDDMYLLSVIQQKVRHHPGLKRDWEDFERMALSDPKHSYAGVQSFIDAYHERQRVKKAKAQRENASGPKAMAASTPTTKSKNEC